MSTPECRHDGWVKGCGFCEAQERAALAAMGEPADPVTDEEEGDRDV